MADLPARVRTLYRQCLRACPTVVDLYRLDVSAAQLRKRLRDDFVACAPEVADVLLLKGKLELQETLSLWKQKSHVMAWFQRQPPQQRSFLASFYSN